MADWAGEAEFKTELRALTTTSASRITTAARLAMQGARHYKAVVALVEKQLHGGKPECKLPLVYLINQLCRQAQAKLKDKDPFTPRFALHIADTVRAVLTLSSSTNRQTADLVQAMRNCPEADLPAVQRCVRLWWEGAVFPREALGPLLTAGGAPAPAPAPAAAAPPAPGAAPVPPLPTPAASSPAPAAALSSLSSPATPTPGPHPLPLSSLAPGVAHLAPSFHFPPPHLPPSLAAPLPYSLAPAAPSHWAPAPHYDPPPFDYGDEQDDEERLAEQKRRRLEEERRANAAGTPPVLAPAPAPAPAAALPAPAPAAAAAPPHLLPRFSDSPAAASAELPRSGTPRGQRTVYSTTLFVGRLPPGATAAQVRAVFERLGPVTRCTVPPGKDHAFVSFATREAAEHARRLADGQPLEPGAPQPLRIGWGRGELPAHLFDTHTGVATIPSDDSDPAAHPPPLPHSQAPRAGFPRGWSGPGPGQGLDDGAGRPGKRGWDQAQQHYAV